MGLSTIQWTDYTFNPWIGCRKVAPECANCYAETLDRNRYSKTLRPGTKENPVSHWGSGPRYRTKTWKNPLVWNKTAICGHCGSAEWIGSDDCRKCGTNFSTKTRRRPRVFCASLADWLDDENVPIEWFADLLKLIQDTPNLDWLLLTKRPQNWRSRIEQVVGLSCRTGCRTEDPYGTAGWLANRWQHNEPPANVWIGVSAGADQRAALEIPARIHFISCEPMLRPIDRQHDRIAAFDWAIFGGESGKKARPCNIDWIRDAVKFCREFKVAPFVKQLGSTVLFTDKGALGGTTFAGKLKDSHGGDMDEWPDDLRVREFPSGGRPADRAFRLTPAT